MEDLLRYNHVGRTFFVTTETHGREPILLDCAREIRGALGISSVSFHYQLIAWVILPDHLHMLVHSDLSELGPFMNGLKCGSGMWIRKRLGESNGLNWQLNSRNLIIHDQSEFEDSLQYIYCDPVKHGLVSNPLEYPDSSLQELLSPEPVLVNWESEIALLYDREYGE